MVIAAGALAASQLAGAAGGAGAAGALGGLGGLMPQIPNFGQMGYGIYQLAQARKYGNTPRPPFEIAPAAYESLANARNIASQRNILGDAIKGDLARTSASNYRRMLDVTDSPSTMMGNLSQMDEQSKESMRDAELYDTNLWLGNQESLRGELGNMAEWQRKQYEWDALMPYLNAMETARNMEQSGIQNLFGGGEMMATQATNKSMWQDYIDRMYGGSTKEQINKTTAGSTSQITNPPTSRDNWRAPFPYPTQGTIGDYGNNVIFK